MTMKRLLTYITKVNFANNRSKSLKVGFPREISEVLDVYANDSIRWVINLDGDRIIITIEKVDDE